MFSTADSPGARFVRLHLIAADGVTPILVPPHLRPLVYKLRALPTRARAAQLATRIASETWVPYRLTPAVYEYQRLFAEPRQASLWGGTDPAAESLGELRHMLAGRGPTFDTLLLRPRGVDEPWPAPDAFRFDSVRAQVWRYQLDAGAARLRAVKIQEVTLAPEPGER